MTMPDVASVAPHWFWWAMTAACVVWYSTVVVYVAVRGFFDIRNMLRRLAAGQDGCDAARGGGDR